MLATLVIAATLSFTGPSEDLTCLARNVEGEARGEPELGKVAVAHVTLNRLKDGRFGDTVCEVVHADNQFTWTMRHPYIRASNDSYLVAWDAMFGYSEDPTHGALFFRNPMIATRPACLRCTPVVQIGQHVFYKDVE